MTAKEARQQEQAAWAERMEICRELDKNELYRKLERANAKWSSLNKLADGLEALESQQQ